MLSHIYLHEELSTSKGDYQIVKMTKEAQVHKEIEETEPTTHVWLSGRRIACLMFQEDTLSQDYSTKMA